MSEPLAVVSGVVTNHYAFTVQIGAKECLKIGQKSLTSLNDGQIVHHGIASAHSRSQTRSAKLHSLQQSGLQVGILGLLDQVLDLGLGRRILIEEQVHSESHSSGSMQNNSLTWSHLSHSLTFSWRAESILCQIFEIKRRFFLKRRVKF